jgi:hypothetical protein
MKKASTIIKSFFVLTLMVSLAVVYGKLINTPNEPEPSKQDPQLYVGASYMTFLGTGMPGHDWNSGAPVDFPNATLGNYSSGNPNTANLQIDMATDHGINFFFLDYGWGNDQDNRSMVNASLDGIINASESPAEAAKNFKFCVMYFTDWRVINPNSLNATMDEVGLNEDFSFLSETYFKHTNYLKLNDCPVVILEDFPYYLNASYFLNSTGEFQNSFQEVNNEFNYLKNTCSLFLVPAFWPNSATVAKVVLNDSRRIYDAITLLGDNTILNINGNLSYPDYVSRTENNFSNWSNISTTYNVSFVPLICPGYSREINSVYYNSSDTKWWAITTRDPTYPNLTLWKEVWQSAQTYAESSNNTYHMVLLFTWNDYNEGTYIEPSMKYNSAYLDAIPEFSSTIILLLIVLLILTQTSLAVAIFKRKHPKQQGSR